MTLNIENGNGGNEAPFVALAAAEFCSFGGSVYRKHNDNTALRIDPTGYELVTSFAADNIVTRLPSVTVTPIPLSAAEIPVGKAYSSGGVDYLIVADNLVMTASEFIYDRPDNGDAKLLKDFDFTVDP